MQRLFMLSLISLICCAGVGTSSSAEPAVWRFDFGNVVVTISDGQKEIARQTIVELAVHYDTVNVWKREIVRLGHVVLDQAWNRTQSKYGEDPKQWHALAKEALCRHKLGYMESLDGVPSLDHRNDVELPFLTTVDGSTIRCK